MSGQRVSCCGFGEYEHRCENPAGSTHSPFFCQRCEDLRLAHISKQFEAIAAKFERESAA